MWVESMEIRWFRNFSEVQQMAVERDVTCLIGKNESGKARSLSICFGEGSG
jgi:predicted ATP-dependent endonuclease of OLD family